MTFRRQDDPGHVVAQYRDPSNLTSRIDLHARFSTNDYGWHRWVFDRIEATGASNVIEIGCGPGSLWSSQRERLGHRSVTLCDRSEGMIEQARSALDGPFTFVVVDAQALPFEDARFDLVVANHMLYHVPDRQTAVAEFARVLSPGGRLVAATNGPVHLTQLRELLKVEWGKTSEFDLDTGGRQLERSFDEVRMERYEDTLRVTDADALVAYVHSMSEFWPGTTPAAELRAHVQDVIDRYGAFVIDKDPGVFTAVKR